MSNQVCRACGEVVDLSEFTKAPDTQPSRFRFEAGELSGYCFTCFCELEIGVTPMVTDSSLPAPGTGLTYRQRLGHWHTDGG